MKLTSKQKRFLKSKAHHLTPIIQIGKNGLNNEIKTSVREALDRRELIKITLLKNTEEEIEEVAAILEEQLSLHVVQIIGRTIVLFKSSTKENYRKISKEVRQLS